MNCRVLALAAFVSLAVAALALLAGQAGAGPQVGVTPTPIGPGSAGGPCSVNGGIDSVELQMLQLINDHRAQNGRAVLQLSDTLNKAAQWKSNHMANENYFEHDDAPIGRSWQQRIRDCGYAHNPIGENIAAGLEEAQGMFDLWRNSPPHNANMLEPDFASIGIGRAFGSGSQFGWYWTTDFGGVADGFTPPTPTATPPPTPTSCIEGDVDRNGLISSIDAQLVLQVDVGIISSVACFTSGDVNEDGLVNTLDAAIILQFESGIIGQLTR